MVTVVAGGLRAWRLGRAGWRLPGSVSVIWSRWVAASCRAVRLYVASTGFPLALQVAARVPAARNRARCMARRDCPWFPPGWVALA